MTFSTSDGWRPNVSQIIMHWHNPSRILGPSDIPTTSLSAASAQLPVICPADLQLLSTCDSFLNEGASRLRPTKPSNWAMKMKPTWHNKKCHGIHGELLQKIARPPRPKKSTESTVLTMTCNALVIFVQPLPG